jgi:exodeoxyribonuclease VII large subunit
MGRSTKSQWDFGELFPPEQFQKVWTVSELTGEIRRRLEKEFPRLRVTGEVTNLRLQNSGHIYFTLKDSGAQLSCVLFRGEPGIDRSLLEDGRKVLAGGDLTVYEPRGQYQLRVTSLELQGVGALQAAFEKLKQKLKAEGLFATERKRPLPRFPQRVGVVTSPSGAALRDVLHVVRRRHPALELVLAPCRVQGEGAAEEIAAAIALLNDYAARTTDAAGRPGLEVVLVTRGGGSLEDLWAFNEEVVARAIFNSALPVVSAVGHEIDFTISDFVADVRAATPSAAAEILTDGMFRSVEFVGEARQRLRELGRRQLESKGEELADWMRRMQRAQPRRRVNEWLQRLDDLQGGLARCARQGVRDRRVAWRNLAERLFRTRPAVQLKQRQELLRLAGQRLKEQARHRLREARNGVETLQTRLRLLGPEQVLARGYSITLDAETGAVLRDAAGLEPGRKLRTRLKRGGVLSEVTGTE